MDVEELANKHAGNVIVQRDPVQVYQFRDKDAANVFANRMEAKGHEVSSHSPEPLFNQSQSYFVKTSSRFKEDYHA